MSKEQTLKTTTIVDFDFFDRLRILFGGKIKLTVTTIVPQEAEIPMYNAFCEVNIIKKGSHSLTQDRPTFGYTAPNI